MLNQMNRMVNQSFKDSIPKSLNQTIFAVTVQEIVNKTPKGTAGFFAEIYNIEYNVINQANIINITFTFCNISGSQYRLTNISMMEIKRRTLQEDYKITLASYLNNLYFLWDLNRVYNLTLIKLPSQKIIIETIKKKNMVTNYWNGQNIMIFIVGFVCPVCCCFIIFMCQGVRCFGTREQLFKGKICF
jgi:hypothetical protein